MPGPNVQAILDQLQPAGPTLTKPTSMLDRFKAVMEPSVVAPPPAVQGEAISVVGAPQGLVEALAPLSKGSLARGTELAQELAGRVKDYRPKPRPWGIPKAVKKLVAFLDNTEPEPFNVAKLAALDKVTGTRPPSAPNIQLPKDFTMTRSGRPMLTQDFQNFRSPRDPQIDTIRRVWEKYEKATRPSARATNEARPLSGRWNNRSLGSGGQVGNQANQLKAALKKKP